MSFFSYQPREESPAKPKPEPEMNQKVNPHNVLISGDNFIKVIDDNPELPSGKVDIGQGMLRSWVPLNYNPETGEISEWK